MIGLIRTIFIILLIYFAGKIVSRVILPFFFRGYINKKMQQQGGTLHRKPTKKEGEITVNYHPKQKKSFGKEDGDYVDFEEIK
jgi:hypothetical protein